MNAAPSLTVVTVCRNVLPALERTVDSVLAQDYPALEYWIIDGASTDGTQARLAELRARGIHTLSEPDRGISDAMNKGLERATGEWVAHLHADDTYLPGALARFAEHARADVDIVSGWIVKVEDHGEVVCRNDPDLMPANMGLNHPSTFVRRALFERLGGFDVTLRYAMDYDFFLRAYLAGARIALVDAPLTRMPGGGLSERSIWRTLAETRTIRRRYRTSRWHRSRAWILLLAARGYTRLWLQRLGLHGVVAWYRRTLAWPRKG